MNDESGSSSSGSSAVSTTTTKTTRTRWVDGKNGKLPWGKGRVLGLVGLPAIGAITALGTLWGVDHIEDQLAAEARRDLAAQGVPVDDLDIDFDYRDGEATGIIPAGMSSAALRDGVDHTLLRDFDLKVESAAAEVRDDPTPEPTAIPQPATGSTEVTAALIDGRVLLEGTVLTTEQRDALVSAASDAVGADNVDNNLAVSGLEAAVSKPEARIATLATLVSTFGDATEAEATLTDTSLDGTFTASSSDAAAATTDLVSDTGLDGVVAVATATGALDASAELIEGQLTLTGTVLNDQQRDQLVTAAEQAVGADNVDDQLTVSNLEPSVADTDQRVATLTTFVATLAGAEAATLSVSDTTFDADIAVSDAATGDLFVGLGSTAAIETSVNVTTNQAPVSAEIEALQGELDDLATDIRENVVFASGSGELSPAAHATLDKIVDAMQTYPLPVVEIAGHTDSSGNAGDNQALSATRAAAVEAYLVAAGIEPDRLASSGAGDTQPIADNATETGRAENRRVTLTAAESLPS